MLLFDCFRKADASLSWKHAAVRRLRLFLALVAMSFSLPLAANDDVQKALAKPFSLDVYYKIKSGQLSEFLDLYKRYHWPVLQAEIEEGHLISINLDRVLLPPPNDAQWDLRVTIVFKNILYAHGLLDRKKKEIISRLYEDHKNFEEQEKRRFSLVENLYVLEPIPISTADWPNKP